ncbi:Rhomboid family protein [Methylocella silvestris BL2]|uniref:Rhomboid family protein n=1 Tax=Methylocella silvestris (strain DSM 15510 / CIP 108128 / LMG 27833 / NCIMB 13906 / BL2) TaxID=395965 RepID=B8EPA3_METSB|nr:Rhomboid family protein [Methylocella silvestris BL2]
MTPARQPIFNVPAVVLALVAILVVIEAVCDAIPPLAHFKIIAAFAFVPGRFTFAFDPDLVNAAFNTTAATSESAAELATFFLGDGKPLWWTPLTYAFLHGGWAHVGMNSLWLVAFGSAAARRFGTGRFLFFCAVCAIAGALAHFLTHMADLQPVVGASAVVSGAMAAVVPFRLPARGAARRRADVRRAPGRRLSAAGVAAAGNRLEPQRHYLRRAVVSRQFPVRRVSRDDRPDRRLRRLGGACRRIFGWAAGVQMV